MSLLHAFAACRYSLFHHLLHSLSSLCFSVLLLPPRSISLSAQTQSVIVSGQSLPVLPKTSLSGRSLDRSTGSSEPQAVQTQRILPRGGAKMSPEKKVSVEKAEHSDTRCLPCRASSLQTTCPPLAKMYVILLSEKIICLEASGANCRRTLSFAFYFRARLQMSERQPVLRHVSKQR